MRPSTAHLVFSLPLWTLLAGCPDGSGADGNTDPDGGTVLVDGGEEVQVPCDAAAFAEKSIRAGETGSEFRELENGDDIAGWIRPQGGIGARINVRFRGFTEDIGQPDSDDGALLRTEFLLVTAGTAVATGPGSACGIDDACEDGLACYDNLCLEVVTSQANLRYNTDCLLDGSVHTPEMPIRFSIEKELEALDNKPMIIRSTLTPADGPEVSNAVEVVLRVGDFIEPSWWDDMMVGDGD